MKFIKYHSIENANEKWINRIRANELGSTDTLWIVQEKVHGANLCFCTDGKTIKVGKRTRFLEDGENFFNSSRVIESHTDKVFRLFDSIKPMYPTLECITVYGELFGGEYPYKDIHKYIYNHIEISMLRPIHKKGVYYCPDIRFVAFDIMITTHSGIDFLPVGKVNYLLHQAGFFYSRTYYQGTLDSCLAHPNKFLTTIPYQLGLPTIEDNFCEGVIIKPAYTKWLKGPRRVIIKSKNEVWEDKIKTCKKKKPCICLPGLSKEGKQALEEAMSFINENRLQSVVSKIGEITNENKSELFKAFNQEVVSELDKHKTLFDLSSDEAKKITKKVNQQTSALVKKYITKGV